MKKKTLITIAAIEVVILVFCLIVSIMVMTTIDPLGNKELNLSNNGPLIGTLQNSPVLFGFAIVLPIFVIFVIDGVYLIMYAAKRESMLSEQEKKDLLEEAKKQAREEALAEIKKEKKE
ncbi:MAG: hypothetical protein MJ228_04050 [Bacilli bacterium]|nr:hypothetical protein [Bacilli bacterium]